jgi:hypothetical protein
LYNDAAQDCEDAKSKLLSEVKSGGERGGLVMSVLPNGQASFGNLQPCWYLAADVILRRLMCIGTRCRGVGGGGVSVKQSCERCS